jgi:hypothetical protein
MQNSIMNANCKLGITYVIGLNCTEDLYINVNELHVSRNHLQITFRNDVLELRDYYANCGSTNGIWIRFAGGNFLEGEKIYELEYQHI